jgi:hypothetical protein
MCSQFSFYPPPYLQVLDYLFLWYISGRSGWPALDFYYFLYIYYPTHTTHIEGIVKGVQHF